MKKENTQNGNALWFILIAIILLGLLTSMLTRSGSSTNDTGDYEQLTIQANEILQYAKSIENGVQSLLARGCSENEISFEASNNLGYTNPNAPADKSCHIFEPEGAGLYLFDFSKYLTLDASVNNLGWANINTSKGAQITGQVEIDGVGINGRTELLFVIPEFKDKRICEIINKNLNIPMDSNGFFGENYYYHQNHFSGTYVKYDSLAIIGNESGNAYYGRKTACMENGAGNGTGDVFLYHTLHAR